MSEFFYTIRKPESTEYEPVRGTFDQFIVPGTTYNLTDPESTFSSRDSVTQVVDFLAKGVVRAQSSTVRYTHYNPHITDKWLKEQAVSKRFYGVTVPEALTIVPTPEAALLNKRVRTAYNFKTSPRRELTPADALSFLIFTRLDSTGRPNYGYMVTSTMFYLAELTEDSAAGIISVKHARRKDVLGIEDLIAQSFHNWENLMRFAVRFPMQGGGGSPR